MNIVQKNCIKLDEKSSNLQNAIYVLLTACRKSQFIAKMRTCDYNWLNEKCIKGHIHTYAYIYT
jgi:hypothetical protein